MAQKTQDMAFFWYEIARRAPTGRVSPVVRHNTTVQVPNDQS